MKSHFTVLNPDLIEMELTISMSLRDWQKLRAAQNQSSPSWELGRQIDQMVDMATKHFYVKEAE